MSRRKRTFAELRRKWTPEQRWRYKVLMAYLHSPLYVEHLWAALRGMQALARVGVTFTPEQQAQIAAMVAEDRTADAQRMILDTLGNEFDG
jgi:hypothetical protein